MKVLFGETFLKSLKKYSSIKKEIQKKADAIIDNPLLHGEPLKGNLRGFYSTPVKGNFLIIYLYCLPCRRKGDYKIVLCSDCKDCPDDTVKFIALGPHDKAYGQ
ncbi:MAG: type II toxin-antitoxin system RelE family toxin [Candidatus Humimicrobiaceae bacterium]